MSFRLGYLAVLVSAATTDNECSESEERELLRSAKRLMADVGYSTNADATNMLAAARSALPELNIPEFVASLPADWLYSLQHDVLRLVFSHRTRSPAKRQWLAGFFAATGIHDYSLLALYDREYAIHPEQRHAWLQELRLPPTASEEEIDAAYRTAASEFHPDRLHDLPPQILALSQAKMAALNAAYEGLRSRGQGPLDIHFKTLTGESFVAADVTDLVCRCWLCDRSNRVPAGANRQTARCGDCHALLGKST